VWEYLQISHSAYFVVTSCNWQFCVKYTSVVQLQATCVPQVNLWWPMNTPTENSFCSKDLTGRLCMCGRLAAYCTKRTCCILYQKDLLHTVPKGLAAYCTKRTCCILYQKDLLHTVPKGLAAYCTKRTCYILYQKDLQHTVPKGLAAYCTKRTCSILYQKDLQHTVPKDTVV
jgi:hypothetical protein